MPSPVLPGNKISGNWKIDSLVSIFRDSTGIRNTQLYPKQPGLDFYFQFNNDGTWSENLLSTGIDPGEQTASNGSYKLSSDTTFDMIYTNGVVQKCSITHLSSTSFTFHLTYPTIFNGITPGTVERIFTLKK